jgi:hypothetical protein
MITGLYLDVWAHRNLGIVETFFTVWHAAFYSGFMATGLWLVVNIMRLTRQAGERRLIIPIGYDTAVIGFAVLGAGGFFDLVWHTIRGIEQSLEALMSPPHLTLMVGGALILSAPFRAAWLSSNDRTPSYRAFSPAVASLALAISMVTLFMMFHWGFETLDFATAEGRVRFARSFVDTDEGRRRLELLTMTRGYTNIMLSNLVLFGPVLIVLRRWRPPIGTVATFFGVVSTYMAGLLTFYPWEWIPVAVVVGLAIDLMIHRLQPAPNRVGAFRAIAIAAPVLLWAVYFALVHSRFKVVWPTEVWVGTIIWSGVMGWGLSLLAAPFAEPAATTLTASRPDTRPAR